MIKRFRARNFRSIVDLELSFDYDELKAPNGYNDMEYWPFLSDKTGRYVPCLVLFGANASGKSNIIKALKVLEKMLENGIKRRFYEPNRIHPGVNETVFEVEFSKNQKTFVYNISYDETGIIEERLSYGGGILYKINRNICDFKRISTQEYSEGRLNEIFKVECCSDTDENRRQMYTFLGRFGERYPGLNTELTLAYKYFQYDLNIFNDNEVPPTLGLRTIEEKSGQERQAFLNDRFVELLQSFDFDIKGVEYEKREFTEDDISKENAWDFDHNNHPCVIIKNKDNVEFEMLYTLHKDVNGREVKFNIKEESEGTKVLFGLLGLILSALEVGNTLVIDELDRSLHPLIMRELVRLFKDKRYNQKNAQLIFTTHTTDLLDDDLLRVSEVGIVDKSLKKGTCVRRLSQFKDIRNVTNFRKRYLDGFFKGIPFPYI